MFLVYTNFWSGSIWTEERKKSKQRVTKGQSNVSQGQGHSMWIWTKKYFCGFSNFLEVFPTNILCRNHIEIWVINTIRFLQYFVLTTSWYIWNPHTMDSNDSIWIFWMYPFLVLGPSFNMLFCILYCTNTETFWAAAHFMLGRYHKKHYVLHAAERLSKTPEAWRVQWNIVWDCTCNSVCRTGYTRTLLCVSQWQIIAPLEVCVQVFVLIRRDKHLSVSPCLFTD